MTQKKDKSTPSEYTGYKNYVTQPETTGSSKKPKRTKKQPKNRGLIWH